MRDDPDELIDALTEHTRAERAADERWRLLTEGALEPDEAQALAEADPERFARHQPFDPGEDDALIDGLMAAVDSGRSTPDGPGREAPPVELAEAPVARVIRPPRWRRAATIVAPLALAAGLTLMVLRPTPGPSLPGYRLVDTSGDRTTRSDDSARVVRPDARLRWVLRPAEAVEGPISARAFVVEDSGPRALPIAFEVAAGGALRADAAIAGALPGRMGQVRLLIAIGPPPRLAELGARPELTLGDLPPDLRVIEHRLTIRE